MVSAYVSTNRKRPGASYPKGHQTVPLVYGFLWLLIFSFPVFLQVYDVITGTDDHIEWHPIFFQWEHIWPFFLLFWLNDFILLPRLFVKGRKCWYFVAVAVAITLMLMLLPGVPEKPPILQELDRMGIRPPEPMKPDRPPLIHKQIGAIAFNSVMAIGMIAINMAVYLYAMQIKNAHRMQAIVSERVQFELESLKYQMNPHFLMNTLNNIHALVDIDPKVAEETIQELSKMLRYILYDTGHNEVPLDNEIECMENFIQLMRIRYPEHVKITVDLPSDTDTVEIPPLLFIPFVENAFKYGVSYEDESCISIAIRIEGDKLYFHCENIIHPMHGNAGAGGIGIANVRRRLKLIYHGDFKLETGSPDGRHYLVDMVLPLETDSETNI